MNFQEAVIQREPDDGNGGGGGGGGESALIYAFLAMFEK